MIISLEKTDRIFIKKNLTDVSSDEEVQVKFWRSSKSGVRTRVLLFSFVILTQYKTWSKLWVLYNQTILLLFDCFFYSAHGQHSANVGLWWQHDGLGSVKKNGLSSSDSALVTESLTDGRWKAIRSFSGAANAWRWQIIYQQFASCSR